MHWVISYGIFAVKSERPHEVQTRRLLKGFPRAVHRNRRSIDPQIPPLLSRESTVILAANGRACQ
jgi:hypothetical protein